VLFLHGGPGAGTDVHHRCFFDPDRYRIILMDQRGAGKSVPYATLQENTTWHLVRDCERLRHHLKIPKWMLFGGSWGGFLALVYAITHPEVVYSMVLRGVYLGRKKEGFWFFQEGASKIFPDEWERFLEPIPVEERGDMIGAYFRRLTSPEKSLRRRAALAWSRWEGANLRLFFDPQKFDDFAEETRADALARIECHYFIHGCFLEEDDWILTRMGKLARIPAVLVHGRYDTICPLENAWELHRAWPGSELRIIPDAGHTSGETGTLDALIDTLDRLASIGM
jgi:proline iminopeptidase